MGYRMTKNRSWWSWTLFICLAWAWFGSAHAATSVLIGPVNPKLYDNERSVALWLENRDAKPVMLQIRVLKWMQRNLSDGYPEQDAIIASPPIATIAPNTKQMIRLIRLKPVPAGTEQAYRVLVDEIPTPVSVLNQPVADSVGVKFQMRYSVPLFVYGKGLWVYDPAEKNGAGSPGLPVLSYHVVKDAGRRYIVVHNTGPVHARLAQVSLVDAAGHAHLLAAGLLGYVLPGAEMRWPLPGDVPQDVAQMQLKVNDELKFWSVRASP